MPYDRTLVFDLVGTLIFPDPPVKEVYCRLGRAHGSSLTEAEVEQRFATAFRAARWERGDDEIHRELWQQIVHQVFQLPSAAEPALFQALWDYFATPEAWSVFPDVAKQWPQLAASDARVAIASNFDARIVPILQGLGLWLEERVFWSSRLRASKPDADFFQAIQWALQVEARSCLMVGDDLQNDYYGATAAGWDAVLLDRDGRHAALDVPRVRSIDELVPRDTD